MNWLNDLASLQGHCVLVTVIDVRGHAPRDAGTKMIVTQKNIFGSVGGGNLEASCIQQAREMLNLKNTKTVLTKFSLTSNANTNHGVQCCGGEVTIVLEYISTDKPQIVLFGAGHVGVALARVLSGLELDVLVIDSRKEMLNDSRFAACLPVASITRLHLSIPEPAFEHIRQGACVFVLTHDHTEDLMIIDQCLKRKDLPYIGLIGSKAKWQNFKNKLLMEGFTEEDLSRITTPIGVTGVHGKEPELIAIAAAAQVLGLLNLQSK